MYARGAKANLPFAFCYKIVLKRDLSMVPSPRWLPSVVRLAAREAMRIVVSKRAVCAVGEDRRLRTVPVLLESFADLLLLHAPAVRERLGRYSGHELGAPPSRPPFFLLHSASSLVFLHFFFWPDAATASSLAYQYLCRFVFIKILTCVEKNLSILV